MRQLLLITLLVFVQNIFGQQKSNNQSTETLTNNTIINLVKSKVPSSIVVTKIKTSKTNFDLSTDALIELSKNNVSEEIINAMMAIDKAVGNDVKTSVDVGQFKYPGIYYVDNLNNINRQLDPIVFAQSKSSGGLLRLVVGAFAKGKGISTVSGSKANLQIHDSEPTFYFYFSKTNPSFKNITTDLFEKAQSPNEFILVKFKLYSGKNIREIEMGSTNIESDTYGVSETQLISFKYEKLSETTYKITFNKRLEKGEYCFMPTLNSSTQGDASKLYDFGISN